MGDHDAVVVLSGGMDSTTLLYRYAKRGGRVHAVSFDYGQRHRRELEYAEKTCQKLGVLWKMFDLSGIKDAVAGSALTGGGPVPHGHYADETMKATVVPNRNMLMLSIAMAYAITVDAGVVAYAAHAGDHAIYPDCRPEFVEAMKRVALLVDFKPRVIDAPYILMTKADIAREGAVLGVDYSMTWSCYEGGDVHCARCGTCVERREAFALAGVVDPTRYQA